MLAHAMSSVGNGGCGDVVAIGGDWLSTAEDVIKCS